MGPAPMGYAFLADTATPVLRAKTSDAGWGIHVGYFYAPLALITLLLTYSTIPETTGRSFQELDELFRGQNIG
ncbi:MAG: hypothetical protein STHCBS139747_006199 [Sporothrix thermara]